MLNREGPLLRWSDVARALGVTERQVRHLWSTGRLGGVHVGRHVRFRVADVADFIAAHSTPPGRDRQKRQNAAAPPILTDGANDLLNQAASSIAPGDPQRGAAGDGR